MKTDYPLLNKKNFLRAVILSTIFIFLFILNGRAITKGQVSLKDTLQDTLVDDKTLINSVAPFPYQLFSAEPNDSIARRLMDLYLVLLFEWDNILLREFQLVPGHNDMGYYGDGGNLENSVRPICYAALVNAFTLKVRSYPAGINISESQGLAMEDCAIKAIRYLAYSHITGEGECAGGGKWSSNWQPPHYSQSSLWMRAVALAGWILWEDMDRELKIRVARMLEFEANRFIDAEPKNNKFDDTGAEENAWNSQYTSLASNMMPTHPDRDKWDQAAKKYMYNSFSVAADLEDTNTGDDGKMIKDWVTTINLHPDFTLENHNRVHVGYLKNTLCLLLENALDYELMGNQIPDALFHHVPETFKILERSMAQEAVPVFWGSNDWRVVHSQVTDILAYTAMNIFRDDRAAAYLEDVAIGYIRSNQEKNNGYFNFRRDLEWSGLVATRLLNAWFLYAIHGGGSTPITEEEYDNLFNNVTYFQYGKTVIHRTSTKFASFSWNAYLLGLSFNKNGQWQNWPRESSYIGIINGSEAGRKGTSIINMNPDINETGFTITGKINRTGEGLDLVQDFSFTSLSGDITVYIERLTKISGSVTSRETGLVGHEFELWEPDRILYTGEGVKTVLVNGEESIRIFTNWLNIGGKIGYVVCRNGPQNMMTYHYLDERTRDCDFISLIGENSSDWTSDWACY